METVARIAIALMPMPAKDRGTDPVMAPAAPVVVQRWSSPPNVRRIARLRSVPK